jgi:hypothetical protein
VLQALTAPDHPWWRARELADVLLSRAPTDGQLEQARTAVLQALTATGDPWHVGGFAGVLLSLAPTDGELEQARTAVLRALTGTEDPGASSPSSRYCCLWSPRMTSGGRPALRCCRP